MAHTSARVPEPRWQSQRGSLALSSNNFEDHNTHGPEIKFIARVVQAALLVDAEGIVRSVAIEISVSHLTFFAHSGNI